jgi:hypothetical protein
MRVLAVGIAALAVGVGGTLGVQRLADDDEPSEPCAYFTAFAEELPDSLDAASSINERPDSPDSPVLTQDDLDWAGAVLDLREQACDG